VLECYLYDFSRDKFQSLFENVVLESLKFFFFQIVISLYLYAIKKRLAFSPWVLVVVARLKEVGVKPWPISRAREGKLVLLCKVDTTNLVTHLNQTPIF
jgi:hypothetical protein